MSRIICFDIETTGLDYAHGDRCVEIGAVEIIDDKITDNSFHEYINPEGRIITDEVYMVHKLSSDFLKTKPTMDIIAPKFLEYIGDSPIVAHNGKEFDFPFMNTELARLNLPKIDESRWLDSMIIARDRVYQIKSLSLDSLAKFFGVSLTARADAHGALIDSEILANVYLEMMATTKPAQDINDYIKERHKDFLNMKKFGSDFPTRHFDIPQDELETHNQFMDKLLNPKK